MLVIDFDKDSARVYRRKEVRQSDGSYKRPSVRLGTLPLTAIALPPDFPPAPHAPLTDRELATLQKKLFDKAKVVLEQRRLEEQERLLDPVRRIASARELLEEATLLSKERPVDADVLKDLLKLLFAVRSADALFLLGAVREAMVAAAAACDADVFGTRPDSTPMMGTEVALHWAELNDALAGNGRSLKRALQERKWVVRKG